MIYRTHLKDSDISTSFGNYHSRLEVGNLSTKFSKLPTSSINTSLRKTHSKVLKQLFVMEYSV